MKRKSWIALVIAILGVSLSVMIGYPRRDRPHDAVYDSDHLPRPGIARVNSRATTENSASLGSHPHEGLSQPQNDESVAAEVPEVTEELSEPDIIAALQTLTAVESMAHIENLVQQLAAKNYPAALAFAREQPAGFVRERLVERVAFVQAQHAPADAARLVIEEIAPGHRQSEAVVMVLHQWALNDPRGARGWVAMFPEGELKERASRELNGLDN
jgi:hypothetical protein